MFEIAKAEPEDFRGRFREIVSDPLNILIRRVPNAGMVSDGLVTLHNGNRVPIDGVDAYYEDFADILVINRGVHEPLEEYAFQCLLGKIDTCPTMLELGAYWGHYSMWLQRALPRANLILVEPDVRNLEVGRSNFALNGCRGVFIQDEVGRGGFEVDNFLSSMSDRSLSLLHADIQGYELEMIKGAAGQLREGSIDYIMISTHSDELHYGVIDVLETHGYAIEISSNVSTETTACDGFIFATKPGMARVFKDFRPLSRLDIVGMSSDTILAWLLHTHETNQGARGGGPS